MRSHAAVPILAAGGIGIVVLLAIAVTGGMSDAFDRAIIEAVRSPELHDALSPLRAITELGSTGAVALVAVITVVVFLIGLSRVWLGVHYPTDVLAGWTAGAVIVLVYARVTRRVSPEPAAAAVDADPAQPRSDPPAAG